MIAYIHGMYHRITPSLKPRKVTTHLGSPKQEASLSLGWLDYRFPQMNSRTFIYWGSK